MDRAEGAADVGPAVLNALGHRSGPGFMSRRNCMTDDMANEFCCYASTRPKIGKAQVKDTSRHFVAPCTVEETRRDADLPLGSSPSDEPI